MNFKELISEVDKNWKDKFKQKWSTKPLKPKSNLVDGNVWKVDCYKSLVKGDHPDSIIGYSTFGGCTLNDKIQEIKDHLISYTKHYDDALYYGGIAHYRDITIIENGLEELILFIPDTNEWYRYLKNWQNWVPGDFCQWNNLIIDCTRAIAEIHKI